MNKIKITTPGKLFLAGEYAITQPGNLAIVAAINLGLTLTISETHNNMSTMTSNLIESPLTFNIDHLPNTVADTKWCYALSAVHIVQDYIYHHQKPLLKEFNININSDLDHSTGKLGLGSSAAVVVAVVEGLDRYFKLHLSRIQLFKLAALAHLNVQQSGSLGDIAVGVYHGIIAYSSPNLSKFEQPYTAKIVDSPWPGLHIEPLTWPINWQLYLAPTYQAASTKKALKSVQIPAVFYKQNITIVDKIIIAIKSQNYQQLKQYIAYNQALLTEYLPATYSTAKLATVLSYIQQHQLAGKISGAGFGDNAYIITLTQEPLSATNFDVLPVTIYEDLKIGGNYD